MPHSGRPMPATALRCEPAVPPHRLAFLKVHAAADAVDIAAIVPRESACSGACIAAGACALRAELALLAGGAGRERERREQRVCVRMLRCGIPFPGRSLIWQPRPVPSPTTLGPWPSPAG